MSVTTSVSKTLSAKTMRDLKSISRDIRSCFSTSLMPTVLISAFLLGPIGETFGDECSVDITISVTEAAPYDTVSGTVAGVDPGQVRVVVFVRTNGWYIQPYGDERAYLSVRADGSYKTWIRDWRQISAFVIRKEYDVLQEPYKPFPLSVDCENVLAVVAYPALRFSGYEWAIKAGDSLGPGSNYFSASSDNVWVDDQDRLHLKISKRDGRWYCAEIYLMQSLGYGTYTFYMSSRVDLLDRKVVGSPFVYEDDNHELDVEFSRWDVEGGPNAQFVVQPWELPGHRERFHMSLDTENSTHLISWVPGYVSFQSAQGHHLHPSKEQIIYEWEYMGDDVPAEGDERVHLNLWLLEGQSPSDDQEAEMVIGAFEWMRFLYGDVTGNGAVTAYDASEILQHTVRLRTLTGEDSVAAEVSGNDTISAYDASLVLQYVVGKRETFPEEEGRQEKVVYTPRTVWMGQVRTLSDGRRSLPVLIDEMEGVVAGEMMLSFEGHVGDVTVSTTKWTDGYLLANNVQDSHIKVSIAGAESSTGRGALLEIGFEEMVAGIPSPLTLDRMRLNEGRIPVRIIGKDEEMPFWLAGDFDGNREIDLSDFLLFVSHFGRSSDDDEFDPIYDLEWNGRIDLDDFLLFVADFGKVAANPRR